MDFHFQRRISSTCLAPGEGKYRNWSLPRLEYLIEKCISWLWTGSYSGSAAVIKSVRDKCLDKSSYGKHYVTAIQ
jgi:hypothetical protein